MISRLSIHELMTGLPVATVIFDMNGQIVAAGDSFWKICGLNTPAASLSKLGSLGITLQHIADCREIEEGHYRWKGSLGQLYVIWRQSTTELGPIIIACLTRDDMNVSGNNTPQSTEAPLPAGRDLPNPEATLELLNRAFNACKKDRAPLCMARIGVYTTDGNNLLQTDREAWRTVGRKLRATCRMSDLLGVAPNGDFLIILANTQSQEAQVAVRRVIIQLNIWMTANLAWPMRVTTGFASMAPGQVRSAEDLLKQVNENKELPVA